MSINLNNQNKLKKWISDLNKKSSKKVLLIYGKSGLGKYTSVYNILSEMEYDVHTCIVQCHCPKQLQSI